jgi:hypothetical protein
MCVVTTGPLLIAGGFGWLGATAFHWAFEAQRQELTAQRLFMRSLSKSSARHSAHIRLGPADFGVPAPTREERSALTKSASPPAKQTSPSTCSQSNLSWVLTLKADKALGSPSW